MIYNLLVASIEKLVYFYHCLSEWGEWSVWSDCSVTCGDGKITATRACKTGTDCQGDAEKTKPCDNLPACPGMDIFSFVYS